MSQVSIFIANKDSIYQSNIYRWVSLCTDSSRSCSSSSSSSFSFVLFLHNFAWDMICSCGRHKQKEDVNKIYCDLFTHNLSLSHSHFCEFRNKITFHGFGMCFCNQTYMYRWHAFAFTISTSDLLIVLARYLSFFTSYIFHWQIKRIVFFFR